MRLLSSLLGAYAPAPAPLLLLPGQGEHEFNLKKKKVTLKSCCRNSYSTHLLACSTHLTKNGFAFLPVFSAPNLPIKTVTTLTKLYNS